MSDTNTTRREEGNSRYSPASRGSRNSGLVCGIIMMMVGGLWLAQKAGLVSLAWLHGVPFWPIALILLGAWMVLAGIIRRRRRSSEPCC